VPAPTDSVAAAIPHLDHKTQALVCLAALIAIGGDCACYRRNVADARAAGATEDEVVGTLLAVAATIGIAGLVSATSDVALGLGYDIDRALERQPARPSSEFERIERALGNGA
jgi:4-carboxymuconolactone decarboxylase